MPSFWTLVHISGATCFQVVFQQESQIALTETVSKIIKSSKTDQYLRRYNVSKFGLENPSRAFVSIVSAEIISARRFLKNVYNFWTERRLTEQVTFLRRSSEELFNAPSNFLGLSLSEEISKTSLVSARIIPARRITLTVNISQAKLGTTKIFTVLRSSRRDDSESLFRFLGHWLLHGLLDFA